MATVTPTTPDYDPDLPVYAQPDDISYENVGIEQKPVESYVDPSLATVEGRTTGILSSGNPLLEMARADNARQYNARGLLNSGNAVAGGTQATMREAREIATPDAALYGDMSKMALDADQKAALANQAGKINLGAAMNQAKLDAAGMTHEYGNRAALARQEHSFDTDLLQQGQANTLEQMAQQQKNNIALVQQNHANTLSVLAKEFGYNMDIQQMQNDFQQDLTQMGFDHESTMALGNAFTAWVDSQLAVMGRVMSTPGATWTQTMADDLEAAINAGKTWLAGAYDIPLSD